MKVIVDVELTQEGHKTQFRVENCKTLEGGAIDVVDYKKCLTIARNTIDSTLTSLPEK